MLIVGDKGYVAELPWPSLEGGRIILAPSEASLRAIATVHDTDAVLVGDEGTIWRYARKALVADESPTREDLLAVVASAHDGSVWAAGKGGVIVRRSRGRGWERVDSPAEGTWRALTIDRRGSVWVGGAAGVYRLVASKWERRYAGAVKALSTDGRLNVVALPEDQALSPVYFDGDDDGRPLSEWPAGLVALAPSPYQQNSAFPRDTRWVWQSDAPLPSLDVFDANPGVEFDGILTRELSPVQRGFDTPILFGGLTWALPDGAERRSLYNTAIMLGADGRVIGTYDKVYLLAFGEYMPFGETFPSLYDAFPQAGRFTPGDEVRVFDFRGHRIGVMVCYEDILATFTNRLAREKPNIIINVTNDAWFGRTSEPHLHLALAVFRAVENRLVLVRSTNTGVSAIIEPTGRISQQTSIDDPETLLADTALMAGGTIYSYVGHGFAWGLFVWLLAEAALLRWRRRRSPPAQQEAA